MPDPDVRRARRARWDVRFVLALGILWAVAHWRLVDAFLWGVTVCDHRGRRSLHWLFSEAVKCRVETDLTVIWPMVFLWFVLGPFFLGGTLIFLWIQRDEAL